MDQKAYDAKKRILAAAREWDEQNTTRIGLQFNCEYDSDIVDKINSVPNKQGYIKDLIRRDLRAKGLLK